MWHVKVGILNLFLTEFQYMHMLAECSYIQFAIMLNRQQMSGKNAHLSILRSFIGIVLLINMYFMTVQSHMHYNINNQLTRFNLFKVIMAYLFKNYQ
jgi:hypothetical protein